MVVPKQMLLNACLAKLLCVNLCLLIPFVLHNVNRLAPQLTRQNARQSTRPFARLLVSQGGDILPKSPLALRNQAINFSQLKQSLCRVEIHCIVCDGLCSVLENKPWFSRCDLSHENFKCQECGAQVYFCTDLEGVQQYIPYSKALVFPLDLQLRQRLDGMYLQDVVDTSLRLQPTWKAGKYSGDTLDSERVREIFRQEPNCRVDLSDPRHGKLFILYTITSDSHDPFETFNYSMWDQWLVVHNQPAESRTWASRPFLLKVTADGKKPRNLKAHLEFFAKWKHDFAKGK